MRIGLIGFGSIGSYLVSQLPQHEWLVFDEAADKARQAIQSRDLKSVRVVDSVDAILREQPALVVEAASQAAVPELLEALPVCDVLVMSVGALTDDALLAQLKAAATASKRRILIPSGAVGGLDVLQSCNPREVVLETRKPPKGLGRSDTKETVVFEGPAREACRQFPKNVNVAATLSLAGIGFDRTRVRVVSDPAATQNTHTVRICGDAGNYEFVFANVPFSGNPATSELAARSAVRAIAKQSDAVQIG
ncbi:aspartate dehydrogenase [Candidatus Micrarchaeota archaeon]|nr:aspartate dehydrogenase [Candidatus Micrarchaeota archaeon]